MSLFTLPPAQSDNPEVNEKRDHMDRALATIGVIVVALLIAKLMGLF